ncbi:adenylate/guanylate cyclase domain-containing protein [Nocardioides sp. LS1]|uniref:adenylate/guanylate cyclase domain-containing protein n=1 Tax=Nocardioides sp. LS1 TaxID=1027620 RepID=UPI000F61FF48|nr:adenylate/guanylate cyclase domain-containing protein [Nocardioides sp. LS1]GCD92025.1 hypothetical protein NLS1_40310 [Nocardioides sp. LS1]
MADGQPPDPGGLSCAQCGEELPAKARFCLSCGTPVPTGAERETRRTVTLLFTDVTGSTALGERLDPEAYRGVMTRYFEVARAAVERHGGTVEKFVGDAVLAVFGVPEVREDDALRAVRAAQELGEAVAALSDDLAAEIGVRLVIRTGVNTGSVVTGAARAGGSFATGDAVNTAARLEQAAPPGRILLGADTWALVRDAVDVEPAEPVLAKGKSEPVAAYLLREVLDVDRGRRRRQDAQLVGRLQETRALDDALERTLSSGRSHLVTVLGPAGIGKSRLVTEFLARVGDRAAVASGRCVSYGQGITYWPLVQALRGALHLNGTESDEITRHALEQALTAAGDGGDVADLLMPLLGKSGTPGGTSDTVWAVRRLLEELASRHPLVLTVDDLHWAEPTLLDLLERVRDEVADLPLLLLCQARPELLEDNPGWGSGALNSLTFGLDPLTPSETDESVAALLGADLPGGLGDTVAAWSGGNPLFVEEIVAHLVESGVLARDGDGSWLLTGELSLTDMPPTVAALLASRLDRLPAEERDLLERLSVIGLEFGTEDATLLVEPDAVAHLGSRLASLARRDLLRRVRGTGGDTWAFKHLMVRDAAYDGLAKSLRAELHERFATGLEAGGEQAAGETMSFVAHHLEQAARYRRELGVRGPEVEALVDRATTAMARAAGQARDREQHEAGVVLLQRALELRPATSASRRDLLERLAELQQDLLELEKLEPTLALLEAELDETATDLDRALFTTLRRLVTMDAGGAMDPADVVEAADELIALARAAGRPRLVVRGLRARADTCMMRARWTEGAEVVEEILHIGGAEDVRMAHMQRGAALFYGRAPLREAAAVMDSQASHGGLTERALVRIECMRAIVAAAAGSPEAAATCAAALARIDALEADGRHFSHPFLAHAYFISDDLDSGIAFLQRVNDEFRALGDLSHASTYIAMQCAAMLERGDPVEVVAPLVDEAERYTSEHDIISVVLVACCRALVTARAGDLDRAWAIARETLELVGRTDQAWQQADCTRWLSEVARLRGDRDAERRLLEDARRLYRVKEITLYDPRLAARIAELA